MAGHGGQSQQMAMMQMMMQLQQQQQLQSQQQNAQQQREPVIQAQVSTDTANLVRQFSNPFAMGQGSAFSVPFTGVTQGLGQLNSGRA